MICLHRAILTALSTSLILPAFADDEVVLDPLVVTASQAPTKTSNTIAQTTVLTQDDLVHYQGQNALDVLKTQAGVSHYTSGGSDKTSNIYVRGFDSRGTLVLIDGVRYGSLTTGQPALALLPVSDISRIEIAYGASGSSLYGANAMGAVIQVFTKKGSHDGSIVALTAGAGSHNAHQYGTSVTYANTATKLSLSINQSQSDGIDAIVIPNVISQNDKDGFKRQSASISASHRFDRLEVGVNALASRATSQYDSTSKTATEPNIYADQQGGAGSVYATLTYQPNSTIKLQYGESFDHSTNHTGTRNTGRFDSHQKQTTLSLVHALGAGKLIAGAEHLEQAVSSSVAYDQTKRNNQGVYVGYQTNGNRLDAQAFVRHDHNSHYKASTNYNAGLGYRLTSNLRIGANYATGFIAPTFNQLYYPSGGNPSLRPELSKNTEVFAELRGNTHKTRITGYHSDVQDLISGWPAQNISQARVVGVNLTSDWHIGDYVVGFHYDYQEANNTTPDASGKKTNNLLPVRPKHKGTAYVGYSHDKLSLRAEYQRVGNYYMGNNHTYPVAGYGLLNLSGVYELSPHISITQRLNNVLNAKYTTNESFGTRYNEDGINFYTSVTLKY